MRKDYRKQQEFEKDLKFSTTLEKFWFNILLEQLKKDPTIKIISYEDFGIDNSGNYSQKTKNISNADYKIKYEKNGILYDKPVEIKWAPNHLKATFKISNLKSYINQDAYIALFYNSYPNENFNKPKDYLIDTHIKLLQQYLHHFRWGFINKDSMQEMLNTYKIQKPYYMGRKECIIVPSSDFHLFFKSQVIY